MTLKLTIHKPPTGDGARHLQLQQQVNGDLRIDLQETKQERDAALYFLHRLFVIATERGMSLERADLADIQSIAFFLMNRGLHPEDVDAEELRAVMLAAGNSATAPAYEEA